MMRRIGNILMLAASFLLYVPMSCGRLDELKMEMDSLEQRISNLEASVSVINDNALAISALLKENIIIVGMEDTGNGYVLELSDGTSVTVTDGLKAGYVVPLIGIDAEGDWIISMDNGVTFSKIPDTLGATPDDAVTPQVRISAEGNWEYSMDNGESWTVIGPVDGKQVAGIRTWFTEVSYEEGASSMSFTLADGRTFIVPVAGGFTFELQGYEAPASINRAETANFRYASTGVAQVALSVPDGWKAVMTDDMISVTAPAAGEEGIYEIGLLLVSDKGYVKRMALEFELGTLTLPDFSYAGYDHGETAPPDVSALGYRTFDVTDYGAVPDDGLSDRKAFLKTLEAALGVSYKEEQGSLTFEHKAAADAVVYFPEGEYILHSAEDDSEDGSRSIIIRSGNFVIRGAGRGKTVLTMVAPCLPADASVLYSSPDMLQIKHNSAPESFAVAAVLTEDSPKGAFSVTVASAAGIAAGDWVCLHVRNADSDYVAEEVAPYTPEASWDIVQNGVEVVEYHQVKSVDGSVVTFHEPLLHAADAERGWELKTYPHYENVGIEDLTFKGYAKADFVHHGSWEDDGAYKPVSMSRLVNSWMRRVGFESVSEACSFISCADVSTYDIEMTGNRGHSAIRSQASSRVLIAATVDRTSDGAGNFHGVGVSRHSIGTVLWRNVWGKESCFESHATQPRATLIDCCTGGWHRGHQGGDSDQAPHHLADLVIWNFEAVKVGESGVFSWWNEAWWRFLPPTVVGFRTDSGLTFDPDQTERILHMNSIPEEESLYESQLRKRLGFVPGWLLALKETEVK